MGLKLKQHEVIEVMKEIDHDFDGSIDVAEFLARLREELKRFRIMDVDHDGDVSLPAALRCAPTSQSTLVIRRGAAQITYFVAPPLPCVAPPCFIDHLPFRVHRADRRLVLNTARFSDAQVTLEEYNEFVLAQRSANERKLALTAGHTTNASMNSSSR